eukprot:TRINITY_DN770_c0_g4_i1.p2 TRINITY_DN770_c0_g4~~TRINITY_DN770_c0_g4_i1.p2  ORF type:complete len:421 (+),score=209.94 TRINITY_DN770_c0_g4_i1:99-1265(+)
MADDLQLPAGCVFDFNVCDPQKKTSGALSHWVYHVYTKTTLEKFRSRKCTALRRYNDFDWLRKQLTEEFPGCILPPIPEKTLSGTLEKLTARGSDPSALVEYRQRSMRKFLVRVGAHHLTCNSDALQDFLELSEEEFARRLKQPGKKSLEEELGLGSKFKDLFGKVESQEYKQWEDTTDYFNQFQASLEQLKERFGAVVSRRKDLGIATESFGKAFTKSGEAEEQYEKTALSNAMCDIGRHAEHMAGVYTEWAEQDVMQIVESINYYVGLCSSAKDNVKRLQRLISARDGADEAIAVLEKKKDAAAAEAQEKLGNQLRQQQADRDRIRKAVDDFTACFREELTRFHREKSYDMKAVLRAFGELQQEYAGRMRTSWDSVLPTVEAIRSD